MLISEQYLNSYVVCSLVIYVLYFFRGGGCVVLYCNAHVCLYIYTLYLDNLVSRYCMIVLVVQLYFCYCRGYCSLLLFSLSDDTT